MIDEQYNNELTIQIVVNENLDLKTQNANLKEKIRKLEKKVEIREKQLSETKIFYGRRYRTECLKNNKLTDKINELNQLLKENGIIIDL